MGLISRLIRKMQKTKREFDDKMNLHIKELDKIRAIVKSQQTKQVNQIACCDELVSYPRNSDGSNKVKTADNFCRNCGKDLR
jgi:hypothetical protein